MNSANTKSLNAFKKRTSLKPLAESDYFCDSGCRLPRGDYPPGRFGDDESKKITELGIELSDEQDLLNELKRLENEGYEFEAARKRALIWFE